MSPHASVENAANAAEDSRVQAPTVLSRRPEAPSALELVSTALALLNCWLHGLPRDDGDETKLDERAASSEQLATRAIVELLNGAEKTLTHDARGTAAMQTMSAIALLGCIESALWNTAAGESGECPSVGELSAAGRHVRRLLEDVLCDLRAGPAPAGSAA